MHADKKTHQNYKNPRDLVHWPWYSIGF